MMHVTAIQRNTRQRRVILEELRNSRLHPTAAELYDIVRKRLPKISLGTVYRNLELLSELGVIEKLNMVAKEARFDFNTERHYHVRCVRCSRVGDIDGVLPDQIFEETGQADGWKILRRQVEFIGVCPQCRNLVIA